MLDTNTIEFIKVVAVILILNKVANTFLMFKLAGMLQEFHWDFKQMEIHLGHLKDIKWELDKIKNGFENRNGNEE